MPGMHMLSHTPAAAILDQSDILSRLTSNRTVLTQEALWLLPCHQWRQRCFRKQPETIELVPRVPLHKVCWTVLPLVTGLFGWLPLTEGHWSQPQREQPGAHSRCAAKVAFPAGRRVFWRNSWALPMVIRLLKQWPTKLEFPQEPHSRIRKRPLPTKGRAHFYWWFFFSNCPLEDGWWAQVNATARASGSDPNS